MKKFIPFLSIFGLHAIFVGNPADPYLFQEGLILKRTEWITFRGGYFSDFVSKGDYRDEILTDASQPLYSQLSTHAGLLTLNIQNWLDIYGIIGSSFLALESVGDAAIVEMRSNTWEFSWGTGMKAALFHAGNFAFAIDAKYFRTDQAPTYFLFNDLPAPLFDTDLEMKYEETQASVAASYTIDWFVPYLGGLYLWSRIKPMPPRGLLQMVNTSFIQEFNIDCAKTRKNWGFLVGAALMARRSFLLNVEARFFVQNALSISGELRF